MPSMHVIACNFGVLVPRGNWWFTGMLPGAPLGVSAVAAAMDSRGSSDAELKELAGKSISTKKFLTAL